LITLSRTDEASRLQPMEVRDGIPSRCHSLPCLAPEVPEWPALSDRWHPVFCHTPPLCGFSNFQEICGAAPPVCNRNAHTTASSTSFFYFYLFSRCLPKVGLGVLSQTSRSYYAMRNVPRYVLYNTFAESCLTTRPTDHINMLFMRAQQRAKTTAATQVRYLLDEVR
jgi:hypothetical protein